MSNATMKTVTPLDNSAATSKRIGVAKVAFTAPALIDTCNDAIEALFAMRAQAIRGAGEGLDLRKLINEGRD